MVEQECKQHTSHVSSVEGDVLLLRGYDVGMSVSEPWQTSSLESLIPSITPREPAARLGVAVVQQLVDVIVAGRLQPGALLPPEAPLSKQFGVSRTVIRECIKRLDEKGLVTVSQGRGTQVNPPSEWNVLDDFVLRAMIQNDENLGILDELSSVRANLESMMAADAASKANSDETLGRLRAALNSMRRSLERPAEFRQADIEFHEIVMAMSGSRLAHGIARTLFGHALESARYHGRDPERAFEVTLDEHQEIYDAIEEGNPEGARQAMEKHILSSWTRRRLPVQGRPDPIHEASVSGTTK
jgi:GntR family galactonate operon transcriptional repressor